MTSAIEHSKAVHEFLLSPEAYPERPSRVELKETHISWVYLTDRYVYKQKKPVRFEFLDFSTLDRRKHFCEQEVALNHRFSPEVYLGAVPVTATEGQYQLKRGTNVVEWLVKMAKLDEANTLENLILDEQLSQSQVKRLSKRLTDFYTAQAPAMLRSDDFLKNLRHHILANRNDLLIALPSQEAIAQFVASAQLRCLSLEVGTFVQRVADGRVVDGHGDLRPDHIYFRRGKPVIIDCIEFNDEYRKNDVIDELAFLAMECERLGHHEVGDFVQEAYFEASLDDSQPFLASFYKCYRACVRSKVAALRGSQSNGKQQDTARALAEEYLSLARNYAEEIGPKLVILVGGLSGSGKSTLATALREKVFADLLQTDLIRMELFQPDSPNGKYSPEGRQRVYNDMIGRIEASLQRNPTLILDGTFNSHASRAQAAAAAIRCGASVVQIECQCPPDLARDRIVRRLTEHQNASEATPDLVSVQTSEREQPLLDQPILLLDTTRELSDQLDEVLDFARTIVNSNGNPNL